MGLLSVGETTISGLLEGDDVLRTAQACRDLGAKVERDGAVLHRGRRTSTTVAPIGIDLAWHEAAASNQLPRARRSLGGGAGGGGAASGAGAARTNIDTGNCSVVRPGSFAIGVSVLVLVAAALGWALAPDDEAPVVVAPPIVAASPTQVAAPPPIYAPLSEVAPLPAPTLRAAA